MSSMRAHHKSRTGCVNCKTRKVKCDEGRPSCGSCTRRQAACVYLKTRKPGIHQLELSTTAATSRTSKLIPLVGATSISPSPLTSPNLGPGAAELRNLQLVHHYTADTVECFVESLCLGDRALNILRKDFPRLAFQQHVLMDTILAVASIHIGCTEDEAAPLPVARYKDQAIRSLRQAVENLSDDNKQAVMAASMLLSATSFAADRVTEHTGLWAPNWLALAMGPKIFAKRSDASNQQSRANSTPPTLYTAGEFIDYPAPAAIPTGLEAMLHMEDDDEDLPHQPVLHHVAKSIGKLIGSLVLPGHEFWIQLKIKAWPSMIPTREFIDLVQLERPRALVLLSYFLAFLAYLPDVWLYKGTAERDMEKLEMMLDEPWRSHLQIPIAALQIQDKALLRAFLLSQLPPNAVSDEFMFEPFFSTD